MERSADYSPSDDRAWRDANADDSWSASESWYHPDPNGDDGEREFIARLFAFSLGGMVAIAAMCAGVYFRFHGA